jgi:hypothetical protein
MKRKMKRKIFAILAIFTIVSVLCVIQSCNKNDGVTIKQELNPDMEKRIKNISYSDLPAGVIPLKVNSREELYKAIKYYDGLFEKPMAIDSIYDKIHFKSTKAASGPGVLTWYDSIDGVSGFLGYFTGITIKVILGWTTYGAPVHCSSSQASASGCAYWTDDYSTGWWINSNTIHYDVNGSVSYYIIIKSVLTVVAGKAVHDYGEKAIVPTPPIS